MDTAEEVAEQALEEVKQAQLDAEYGIKDLLKGNVSKEEVASGKFVHDVNQIDVDIHALTQGSIDWGAAVDSLQWMVDKTKDALKSHNEAEISQFLAKTCIMHVIQCFHHCRFDKPHGYAGTERAQGKENVAPASAPAAESIPSPPPSGTE